MEKGRRNSSASEFFSRRHSSSFFQSMRRYSTSTVFGLSKPSGGSDNKSDSTKGRRHSSSQPPLSISGGSSGYISGSSKGSPISSRDSPSSGRSDKWRSLARVVLGNVEEHSEHCEHEQSILEDAGRDDYHIPSEEEVEDFCKESIFIPPIRQFIANYR